MGHDVFVSHASQDKLFADALVAHLEHSGIRCWVAPRDILPGANWAGSILKAIADAKLMVLVFSGHTNSSNHIRREVERAIHRGIPVAPVRIADVQPTDDLEYFLSSSHWMDAITAPMETHFARLAETIKLLLKLPADIPAILPPPVVRPAVERSPATSPPAAPAPILSPPVSTPTTRAGAKRRWPRLAAVAVVAAALVAGLIELNREQALSNSKAPAALAVAPATSPTAPIPLVEPVFLSADATRDQRLELLKQLYANKQVTADQVQAGTELMNDSASALSAYDSARLAEINNVLEGRLAADKLGNRLDAIETVRQLQDRLSRDEAAKAQAARQARIDGFLATARANDNEDHDTIALAALAQLFEIDPANREAVQLRDKISKYAPAKQRRMAQEAAAKAVADRQAKIDSLLATARADDNEDHETVALAALDELLKLDPSNATARQLRDKVSQYAPAKQRRMAQEAAAKAAAERQAKIDSLLAAATADDNQEHARDGLAALNELLKLDPQHAAALALREKIRSRLLPSKIGDTWANSLGMKFAYIPAGTFPMGSPSTEAGRYDDETQHKVKLTKGFLMSVTVVTQDQYWNLTGKNPSHFCTDSDKGSHPVEDVSWDDAVAFCKALSQKEGRHYRLPTEAEWEYACRAGSTTAYNNGDGEQALAESGWYEGNSNHRTHAVGQKKPNGWGLYDMHGNVWQWCSDWYGAYPDRDAIDPKGPDNGTDRVSRGGSWQYGLPNCRCANRSSIKPADPHSAVGLRLLLDSE